MQKLSVRKLSLLGLVLTAASAVTAAVLPKDDSLVFNGVQQPSTGGAGNQKTCVDQSGVKNCTFTAPSATTTDGEPTNGRQTDGTSEVDNGSSATPASLNSSASPS
jgi:hypothetical protein